MKEESWVEAHVHAFSFYGGSVPIIVPDNLKQGVAKNTVEELVVNEQYRRMAEHYGCAIVPARPRKPRDKGAIEMGVRVIEQRAMAPLRDRVFTSLAQLNGALMEKVREINARPFPEARRQQGRGLHPPREAAPRPAARQAPTRWLPARPPPSILTTTSPSAGPGTRFRSAT